MDSKITDKNHRFYDENVADLIHTKFAVRIQKLADTKCNPEAREGTHYHPERLNYKDKEVSLEEEIAGEIVEMLIANGLTIIQCLCICVIIVEKGFIHEKTGIHKLFE